MDFEDTPSRNKEGLEEARPESKEEISIVANVLGTKSQLDVTKLFGAATITHPETTYVSLLEF